MTFGEDHHWGRHPKVTPIGPKKGAETKSSISDDEIVKLLDQGWFIGQICREYRVGKARVQKVDRERSPAQREATA